VIAILLSITGFIFVQNKQIVPQTSSSKKITPSKLTEPSVNPITDIQASFAIFTNGTFRIFTAAMYHYLSQDVYIEVSNPNRVQVKKSGTTWNDFFLTLPFKLTSDCLITGTNETYCSGSLGALQFFINGVKYDNALDQEIKDGDKLLVTFGTESEAQIKQQVDRVP
jgi:hypothetical protein